jgi:hypothetical protein
MGFRDPERNSRWPFLRAVSVASSLLSRVTGGLDKLYQRINPRCASGCRAPRQYVEGSCTASNGTFLIDRGTSNRYLSLQLLTGLHI